MIETGILGFIMGFVGIIAIVQVLCFAFLVWYVLKFKTIIKLGGEYMRMMDDLVKDSYDEISKQMRDLVDKTKEGIGSDE